MLLVGRGLVLRRKLNSPKQQRGQRLRIALRLTGEVGLTQSLEHGFSSGRSSYISPFNGFLIVAKATTTRGWRTVRARDLSFHPSSFAMRCTVPVPIPSDFATFKIPTPFASCFRTWRSVALSIFGRPSFTPWARARLGLARFAERKIMELREVTPASRLRT